MGIIYSKFKYSCNIWHHIQMFWYKNRPCDKLPMVSKERWAEIKKKFPHFPEIEDMEADRREALFRLPPALEEWATKTFLADPRDAIMMSLILNMIFLVFPLIAVNY